jgi:MerR family transcriptional regulator, mercuric resistance operon regulatory protein
MGSDDQTLTIGAFARSADVGIETIRFYQRKGLLRRPERRYGGIRRYGQADLGRLKFIKSAQRLGFSLDEIAQLLSLDDGSTCNKAAEIAAHRLADVRARLSDLTRIEAALSTLLKRCKRPHDDVSCPLIAELEDGRTE